MFHGCSLQNQQFWVVHTTSSPCFPNVSTLRNRKRNTDTTMAPQVSWEGTGTWAMELGVGMKYSKWGLVFFSCLRHSFASRVKQTRHEASKKEPSASRNSQLVGPRWIWICLLHFPFWWPLPQVLKACILVSTSCFRTRAVLIRLWESPRHVVVETLFDLLKLRFILLKVALIAASLGSYNLAQLSAVLVEMSTSFFTCCFNMMRSPKFWLRHNRFSNKYQSKKIGCSATGHCSILQSGVGMIALLPI